MRERATLFVVVQRATGLTISLRYGSLQLHPALPIQVVPSFDNNLGKLGRCLLQYLVLNLLPIPGLRRRLIPDLLHHNGITVQVGPIP